MAGPSTKAARRLYAFEVPPQRNAQNPVAPPGGQVSSADPIARAIDDTTSRIDSKKWINADLQIDHASQNRSHVIRDLIMKIAFGSESDADNAAQMIAMHLSRCTDERSKDALLMIAIANIESGTEVTFWTFPQDEVFQFSAGSRGKRRARVKMLDAFSRRSRLRKAAVFRGKDLRTDFLSCRVVDFQVNSSTREAADFWIYAFLNARLSLGSELGTRLLSKTLRETVANAESPGERLELVGAAQAVRQSTREKWSIESFARELLRGRAQQRLLAHNVAQRSGSSLFTLDRDVFDRLINFRVYELDTGVWVSAQFTDDPAGLEIEERDNEERHLTASGMIVGESVRSRHV